MFWFRIKKIISIIFDPFLFTALMKGAAAGVEHRPVLRNLNVEYLVDIGANRGQFALIARKVYPQAIIHSFEPLEEPGQIFKKVFTGDPNVTLHSCAIGSEKTIASIHITMEDDSSSFLPITKTQSEMFPGATEKGTRQVSVLRLSQALGNTSIPHASLLKIDVQGFELEVLKGCEDILNNFTNLYIECSFLELYESQALAYEVIAWLEQRNFFLSGVYNMYYDKNGTAVQGDFLFTGKQRIGNIKIDG